MSMMDKRVLDHLLRRIRQGRLEVRFWDGEQRRYGTSGPTVHASIHDPAVLRRMLTSASIALGDAYVSGDLEIPEDDLDGLFWVVARNRPHFAALRPLLLLHRNEANRRERQRQQISRHYDVGNDYYRLFLDPSLTYSSAYFQTSADSLADAQQHKVERVLRKLRLRSGQRLLDIGSGWGQLAIAAAQQYDVHALGITLSDQQLKESRERAERVGVADRVQFRLMNFQDLPETTDPVARGPFDRIASVGMFEHVGLKLHPTFFDVVSGLLAPDGVAVLNTITNQQHQHTDAWVDQHIFPGGYLPTVAEVERLLARRGLWSISRENLWQHYAHTLSCWRSNHRRNKERIVAMYDERFYRTRDLWLAGSKAGFDYGTLGLAQFTFSQGKPVRWPVVNVVELSGAA